MEHDAPQGVRQEGCEASRWPDAAGVQGQARAGEEHRQCRDGRRQDPANSRGHAVLGELQGDSSGAQRQGAHS